VKSDGPLDLKIDCSKAVVKAEQCSSRVSLALPRVRGQRVVSVFVTRKGKRVTRSSGRNVRRVSFRRISRKAFSVRVKLRTSGKGGNARTVTLVRRVGGC
jgi:hypothetical protein